MQVPLDAIALTSRLAYNANYPNMRLITVKGENKFETALQDDDGNVYPLRDALDSGRDMLATTPGLLDLIDLWSIYRPMVIGLGEQIVKGEVQPRPSLEVAAPFPYPRRDAFAIAGNYRQHMEAARTTTGVDFERRKGPVFFVKPTGSFVGPTDSIVFDPDYTQAVDYEVELGVVLGKGGRDISADSALDHVFGYMVVNDVSARDQLLRNKPMIDFFRGKGADTFFPMGPGVTPRDWAPAHNDLELRLWVNGELRQSGSTREMVRGVEEIVAELSRSVTLQAGDIIATGTPSGVAIEMEDPKYLQDGDVVKAEIEGLGFLLNSVRSRSADSG